MASCQLDHSKGVLDHTRMDFQPKVKVSDYKKVIECTNRFHILQKDDDVISEHSCDVENTFHAHTNITPAAGRNLDTTFVKASQGDVSIINPRIGQKSKHESKSDKVNAKHQKRQDIQVQRVKPDTVVNNSTSTSSSQANVNPNDESINSTK